MSFQHIISLKMAGVLERQ